MKDVRNNPPLLVFKFGRAIPLVLEQLGERLQYRERKFTPLTVRAYFLTTHKSW